MSRNLLTLGIGAVVLLLIASVWNFWLTLISLVSFTLAYIAGDYFLHSTDGVPDFFSSSDSSSASCRRRLRPYKIDKDISSESSARPCNVCGSASCTRNDCTIGDGICVDIAVGEPKIPKIMDDALQEFLELTLKNYVETWYEVYISREDKAFVRQIRSHIRRALSRFWIRLRNVDLSHLILDEILPAAVNHATVYADLRRQYGNTCENLEEQVLEHMSWKGLLHPTLRNRSSELSYLRRLVEYIIVKCADDNLSLATLTVVREVLTFQVSLPAVDAVAHPDLVNLLLELFFHPTPMRKFDQPLSDKVVLLERFVDEKNPSTLADTVVFQIKLSEIIRDPPMLYIFMTYLKSINAPINWLQFILSAYDIQERLHSGRNLTKEDISHLHWQSWELYRNYVHEGAPDKLGDDIIPVAIVNGLKSGVEAEPEEAVKLISPHLEQAYQLVYHLLQWRYVAPFCQSAKFMEIICAARNRGGDENEANSVIEINANPGEGANCDDEDYQYRQRLLKESMDESGETNDDLNSAGSISNSSSASDEEDLINVQQNVLLVDTVADPVALKDLSQWKVSLPRIEPRRDPQTGRTMYVYVAEVDAMEEGSARWCIDRRYREFYILESKLVEFHGEPILGGFPLPAKKTFNNKSRAFIESLRPIFDQFLKRLLHNPLLKRSELLYAFLTSQSELTSSFLPDPFKVMRGVPSKLARERGQNLSTFLQALVGTVSKEASSDEYLKVAENTGRASPSPVATTVSISSADSATSKKTTFQDKLYGTQYKNNLGIMARSSSAPAGGNIVSGSCISTDHAIVTGVYDILLYLAFKVFRIPNLSWLILVSARTLVRRIFDGYVCRYLRGKLNDAMHEQRLVRLVHSLRDLIFNGDNEEERGEREREERKRNALALAKLYFDVELGLIKRIVGSESFDEGLKIIFECLQCPRLNKQLLYVAVDAVAREIFPDLL